MFPVCAHTREPAAGGVSLDSRRGCRRHDSDHLHPIRPPKPRSKWQPRLRTPEEWLDQATLRGFRTVAHSSLACQIHVSRTCFRARRCPRPATNRWVTTDVCWRQATVIGLPPVVAPPTVVGDRPAAVGGLHQLLAAAHRLLATPTGCWHPPTSCWRPPSGCWRPPTNCWRLPTACWRPPPVVGTPPPVVGDAQRLLAASHQLLRLPAACWRLPTGCWRPATNRWRLPSVRRRRGGLRKRPHSNPTLSLSSDRT